MMKRTLICLILFVQAVMLFGQEQSYFGINFTTERIYKNEIRPGIGVSYGRRITLHSGVEFGIYFRTYKDQIQFTSPYDTFSVDIIERHLSFPFLYKFYSGFINLSAGPSCDIYTGWKAKNSTSSKSAVTGHSIKPKYNLGVMIKAGKGISLFDRLIFEPELRFNYIFNFKRKYMGLGLHFIYYI